MITSAVIVWPGCPLAIKGVQRTIWLVGGHVVASGARRSSRPLVRVPHPLEPSSRASPAKHSSLLLSSPPRSAPSSGGRGRELDSPSRGGASTTTSNGQHACLFSSREKIKTMECVFFLEINDERSNHVLTYLWNTSSIYCMY